MAIDGRCFGSARFCFSTIRLVRRRPAHRLPRRVRRAGV